MPALAATDAVEVAPLVTICAVSMIGVVGATGGGGGAGAPPQPQTTAAIEPERRTAAQNAFLAARIKPIGSPISGRGASDVEPVAFDFEAIPVPGGSESRFVN